MFYSVVYRSSFRLLIIVILPKKNQQKLSWPCFYALVALRSVTSIFGEDPFPALQIESVLISVAFPNQVGA